MKTLLISLIIILTLFSCNKDNNSPSIDYSSIRNTTIYMNSQDKLVKSITIDNDDSLLEKTNYYYNDSIVIKWTKISFLDYQVSIYKIGKNGFSDFSIDSFYYKSKEKDTIIIDTLKYEYDDDGYLLKMLISSNQVFNFSYFDNNLKWKDYIWFGYYDTLNKTDITGFSFCNGICGKINKNLIKHIKWGANGGPSTYAAESNYEYVLDKDGFVIEKEETFYPAHYYNIQLQDKDLKHYLTRYSYIKNYVP